MGGRGYEGVGRGRVYTYRYTVTTRMTCIKMGSDESHFNVSLIVRDKVTRPCPQTVSTVPVKLSPYPLICHHSVCVHACVRACVRSRERERSLRPDDVATV